MITAKPRKWVLFNGVPVKQMAADDQGAQLDLTDFKIGSEGGMVLCQLLVRTTHSRPAWVRFPTACFVSLVAGNSNRRACVSSSRW